jgi:hypothetical protein
MGTLAVDTGNAVSKVNDAKIVLSGYRRDRFASSSVLEDNCARACNLLEASGASKAVVKEARTYLTKIKGYGKKLKVSRDAASVPDSLDAAVKKHSVYQTSFDMCVDHVDKLLSLLGHEPLYTPNELELQVPGIRVQQLDLLDKNQKVVVGQSDLEQAFITRNELTAQLVEDASAAKLYVKGIFGNRSRQSKSLSHLKFRK